MAAPPFDVHRARHETPGCRSVIHLNNAGAALQPAPVLEAVRAHLDLEAAIGGYEAADRARDAVERVYAAAARLIGCHPDEVAVLDSATRAWDMAFHSIPFEPGDRILTSASEYASNFIAFLQVKEKLGVRVEVVPDDETGQLSVAALRDRLDERVRLIAITHVPTNGGLVNPAAEVGAVAREAGVLYLLDACQSVGQMPIDVAALGCDILTATGRKYLRGPRGTAFLYVGRDWLSQLEPPMLDLHAARWVATDRFEIREDARRFESWESNRAAKIGLGVAVDYALDWGLSPIWERVSVLADSLRARLAGIPGIRVRDLGSPRCGIVSFTVEGRSAAAVQEELGRRSINVSVSSRESTLLDMQRRGLEAVVRASVHYYNEDAELDRLCEMLEGLA